MTQASSKIRIQHYADGDSLRQAAMDLIQGAAEAALDQRGAFHIVLAGGSTPKRVYEALKTLDTNWAGWHIYFGDERCLDADHEDRNSHMAANAWLDHVAIPPLQIHPIPAEIGAEVAALAYGQTLSAVDDFDLVLLGLGEDGHTASLFPGQDWGQNIDAPDALAVHNAPKPPPDRVSLSARRLSQSSQVVFLVSGETKHAAMTAWRAGDALPAAAIHSKTWVDVLLDFTF